MVMLKLTTLRMTLEDRWDLEFVGTIIPRNGEFSRKIIKKETNQFFKATYTQKW